MFIAENYNPVRVILGPGKLSELGTVELPGKKALICVTEDQLMAKLGFQDRVLELLKKNGVETVIFDRVIPNPTRDRVMDAARMAKENNCDFVIGLGGGSSIDTAKATAIMAKMPGDLWDYASVGTGGRKPVTDALPIVTVTTTAGTGTECDMFCVITNEKTLEKLDFGIDASFPKLSIIDPELMLKLPRSLTAFQGLDALFHAVECYMCDEGKNKLLELYCREAIGLLTKWVPIAYADGNNLEARTNVAYAANLLGGYIQSMTFVTSHHIIGQCMGGLYPTFPHGATLLVLAEAYYKEVKKYMAEIFDKIGGYMGEEPVPGDPGQSYINGLIKLLDATNTRNLAMSEYGAKEADFDKIAHIVKDTVGIDFDHYDLSYEDIKEILQVSYR